MLEKYLDEQPIVTRLLLNSFDNNKLVQAYLFVSNDKSFLLDYAIAFSKKLITNSYDQNICNMIDNNSYLISVLACPILYICTTSSLSGIPG